jgi:hypothetical protein
MKRKAFYLLYGIVLISVLQISCDGMFPEIIEEKTDTTQNPGGTDPGDGPSPVDSMILYLTGSGGYCAADFTFTDFDTWDDSTALPEFYVLTLETDPVSTAIDGKRVLETYTAAQATSLSSHIFEAPLENVYNHLYGSRYTLVIRASLYWTDNYIPSMATLADGDPLTNDYSGDWQGPVSTDLETTIVVATESGMVDSTPNTDFNGFDSPVIDGSVYSLFHFDLNGADEYSVAQLYFFMQIGSGTNGMVNVCLYRYAWDPAITDNEFWTRTQNSMSMGPAPSITVNVAASDFIFDASPFLPEISYDPQSSGFVLMGGAGLDRTFYGALSFNPPFLLLAH